VLLAKLTLSNNNKKKKKKKKSYTRVAAGQPHRVEWEPFGWRPPTLARGRIGARC
jgi:hypothetical protein